MDNFLIFNCSPDSKIYFLTALDEIIKILNTLFSFHQNTYRGRRLLAGGIVKFQLSMVSLILFSSVHAQLRMTIDLSDSILRNKNAWNGEASLVCKLYDHDGNILTSSQIPNVLYSLCSSRLSKKSFFPPQKHENYSEYW